MKIFEIINKGVGTYGLSGTALTVSEILQIENDESSSISGSINYLPKFTTDGTTLGNSQIQDNGTSVFIGDTSLDYLEWNDLTNQLAIFSQAQFLHKYRGGAVGSLSIGQYDVDGNASINNVSNAKLLLKTNDTDRIEIEADGDVLLKKVDNGLGNFVRIDPTTGRLTQRTSAEVIAEVGGASDDQYITFTPTLIDAGGGATYTLNGPFGQIYRIGRFIQVYVAMTVTSTSGTPTGALRIGGITGGFGINGVVNGTLRLFSGSNQTDIDIALAEPTNIDSPLTTLQFRKKTAGSLSNVVFTAGGIELTYSFTIA